ncbi:MAG: DUF177 domain-containing protein [Bacteroidetes bacterium]|nr:DUF177 domain-containing protein [Bacteroidota bacterium]
MNAFVAYSIPIMGLKIGIHLYQYNLDAGFFSHFEGTPVQSGQVQVNLTLDKRPDMLILDFTVKGYSDVACDRCTAQIHLPLEDQRQLIVKYGEAEGEEEDEVVFIHRESAELNVAKYLYEFTVLALPITNTYNCQADAIPPCNQEILKYLNQNPDEGQSNSIWDALKGGQYK